MSVCDICSNDLPSDGNFVQCNLCKNKMHYNTCSGLAESTWRAMSASRKDSWACPTCKRNTRGRSGSNSSVDYTVDSDKIITTLKTYFQQIIDEKFKAIETTISGLSKSISDNNNNFKAAINRINELVEKNKQLERKIIEIETTNGNLQSEITKANIEIQKLHQYSRRNNLEIHGFPELDGEKETKEIVKRISNTLRVDLKFNDYVSHRIGKKREDRPRIILVKFNNTSTRDDFLKKAKESKVNLKQVDENFPNTPLYVNENLSPYHRQLMYESKRLIKDKNLDYSVWFSNGKILLKKEKGGKPYRIDSKADLLKL